MAASFLLFFSLFLHCRRLTTEERRLCFIYDYMSKPLWALKWLPSANQSESCCGKSVREIKKEWKQRGTKGWRRQKQQLITKHSAVLTPTSTPRCPLTHFFPVYLFLFVPCSRSPYFYSQALLRPSMPTGAMATRHWLRQSLSKYGNQRVCVCVWNFEYINTYSICILIFTA